MLAEFRLAWALLDFNALRETTSPFLIASRTIIEKAYLTSQYTAANFYRSYRAEKIPGEPPIELDVPNPFGVVGRPEIPDRDVGLRIMVSMKVTGPVWLAKNSKPGMSVEDVPALLEAGFSKASGAAIRLTLNGGRGMIRTIAGSDDMARGVAGVASESSCENCKFLETPILKSEGSRKMDAVAVGHDFCTCSAIPIF